MSIKTRKLLGRGLLIAACSGTTIGVAAGADEPRAASASAAPKSSSERYLLLADGRLIQGVITEDDANYVVTQKVGPIRVPKKKAERAFSSLQEVYRYRLERVPEDDPSERLRLARWCLSVHLDREARTLLEQVIEISPDHGPARAMLTSMVQNEATRLARRETKIDEGVKKTAAEEVHEDRPGALDSAVLRGAEHRMGITGLPVIFDLPPAMAVLRTDEFKRYVHPVLQAYCANCHNEKHNGEFQMLPVKSGRRASPDAMRANLDATLRLINPESPEKSILLSSTLLPHGVGGKGRPIFSGSNDRAYRILEKWVMSLRPKPAEEAPVGRRPIESDESFAADRDRPAGESQDTMARAPQAGDPRAPSTMRNPANRAPGGKAYRYVEGQGMVPEDPGQVDPGEFPLPYPVGGPRPTVRGSVSPRGNIPGQPPATIGATGARSSAGTPADELRPRADRSSPVQGEPAAPPMTANQATPAAAKKPVKLDPKFLEQFLKRNANRTDGP